GGGRVSGYFTAATGVTIYRGNAFGPGYVGNAFIADAGSNLVHRKILHGADGILLRGERPADERETEFLASTDNWFRPVQLANGPDGCLYVLDMYREVIEHPWSLPQGIKKHLDLNSGNDRGRIWRIFPDGFDRPAIAHLTEVSSIKLLDALSSPNSWQRETAARLLFERQDVKIAPDLTKLAARGQSHLGRMHALYALAGLELLKPGHLITALGDEHPALREHALKLAEPFLANDPHGKLEKFVLALSRDVSPRVRFQLALTLGLVQLPGELPALLELFEADGKDPWVRAAVLNALSSQANAVFASYASSPRPVDTLSVVALAAALRQGGNALDGLHKHQMAYLRNLATTVGEDSKLPNAVRLQAVGLLVTLDRKAARKPLLTFLDADVASLRDGAVGELLRLRPEGLSGELIARWKTLSVRSRNEVLGYLLGTTGDAKALLAAMEEGTIASGDLSSARMKVLRNLKDDALRKRAVALVGHAPIEGKPIPRKKVIEDFLPALRLVGDAVRGRETYRQRCANCHRSGKEGFALGPDLVAMKAAGAEKLLTNLIDPSREVAADFVAYEVRTSQESIHGLLANETPTHLTIRFPLGKSVTFSRREVGGMRSLGRSLMPEGLEAGLDHQAMADLLAFLVNPGQGLRLPPFDLLVHHDVEGRRRPVRSPQDWEKRRASILDGAKKIMGVLPGEGKKRSTPEVKVVKETDAGTYLRQSINYAASDRSRVPAHLCIPKGVLEGNKKVHAILCLHPTDNKVGRKVVLGLGGRPNRAYAAELAERGFVTLSPAYPLLADYHPDLKKLGFISGTMKAVWDNSRAL
ncbi:MAG: HEAT repeat domain-containing protein, partial [Opitutales bacterium]